MATPTTERDLSTQTLPYGPHTLPLEDGKTIYQGASISQATGIYATSAAYGHLTPFTRSPGLKKRGTYTKASSETQYNTDGSAKLDNAVGDGVYKAQSTRAGFLLKTATVVGSSAKSDVGKYFWELEDGSYTMVEPAIATLHPSIPDGEIIDWISGTDCDIIFYPEWFQSAIEVAGGIYYYEKFPFDWTAVADGKFRSNHTMLHRGEIVEAYVVTDDVLTGSGGTLVVNASLETTDISTSGATISTAATAAQSTETALTLLTAGQTEFSCGDDLDIDISSAGGTRTTGNCTVVFRIMKKLGL